MARISDHEIIHVISKSFFPTQKVLVGGQTSESTTVLSEVATTGNFTGTELFKFISMIYQGQQRAKLECILMIPLYRMVLFNSKSRQISGKYNLTLQNVNSHLYSFMSILMGHL